jgi:hypothetical protein
MIWYRPIFSLTWNKVKTKRTLIKIKGLNSQQDNTAFCDEVLRRVLVIHTPAALPGNPLAKFFGRMTRESQLIFEYLELECALIGSWEEDQKFSRSYQVTCKSVIF